MHLNLLPNGWLIRLLVRRRLWQWSWAWGAALVVGGCLFATRYQHLRNARQELQDLQQRSAPLQQMQQEIAAAEHQLLELEQQILMMQKIEHSDRTLPLFQVLANASRAAEQQLQIQRLNLTAPTPAVATAETASSVPVAAETNLFLNGVVSGDVALAKFVDALRVAGVFKQVDLKSASTWQSNDGTDGRQFQVECRYTE